MSSATRLNLLLASACATLMVASIPPLALPLLAWVGLVPLFLIIFRANFKSLLATSSLAGVIFYTGHLYWIIQIDMINRYTFCIIILFLAAFFPLFCTGARLLHKKLPGFEPLTFPLLWVACEYAKTHIGFLSIPYGILGYSQYTLIPVAAIAEYTGIFGVSFAVVAVNAALGTIVWHWWQATTGTTAPRRVAMPVAIGMLSLTAVIIGGFAISSSLSAKTGHSSLKIAVAQGNAIADQKTGYEKYIRDILPIYEKMTVQAAAAGAPLVIWPAGSVPGILPLDKQGLLDARNIARTNNVYLLFGAAGIDKFNTEQLLGQRITNSSFLLSPEGKLAGRYDKIHLVPFEEYVPLRGNVRWPDWMVNQDKKDNYPGKKLTLFPVDTFRFGVQICFENMFPEQVRELVAKGADFIVGHTNEFYAKSAGARYQNLAFTVFRAIENRVPVIRCSGNGISCIIDGNGRIVKTVRDQSGREIDVAGLAIAELQLSPHRSFYTRFGDVFAEGCAVCSLLLVAGSTLYRRDNYAGGAL